MPSSADVSHKVRQLDNDVQAIYEMISTVQSTQMRHTNRFAELNADVRELTSTVEGLQTRFDGLEQKVDGLDTKVDQILELLRS